MPTINDGSEHLAGFPGTVSGLEQQNVETSKGMRNTERVKAEDNSTAIVVMTDPHTDHVIEAVVLTTYAATLRIGSTMTYAGANYRVTGKSKTATPTMTRLNLTVRKEDSMTYTVA